jgi:hypothetical protein
VELETHVAEPRMLASTPKYPFDLRELVAIAADNTCCPMW